MDKVFVSDLFVESNDETEKGEKMICAFQSLCNALDLKTTIEGVETKEQAEFLSNLGCDVLQGFYFSKPIPHNELLNYLENIEEGCRNV
jgi:EAL domain-containing protein (putative c-di-GMP-specific phosphodiesterase class I)